MLSIALVYDADRRYIFPIDVAIKVLHLSEEDIKKLETELKKELQRL